MKKTILLATILLALVAATGCKKITLGSKANENLQTNENTAAPSVSPSADSESATDEAEATQEATDEKASAKPTKEALKATTDPSSNKNATVGNNNNGTSTVIKDFLETQEYQVKATGTYTFLCKPSDGKATWDIYVLDEKFEDALRYLTSAYQPSLTATSKAQTLKLKQGQYVYCVCSENSRTFDGDEGSFSCPLAIKMN